MTHFTQSYDAELRSGSVIGTAIARLRNHLATRRQRRIDRLAFQTMLNLDDELLNDIGVTRENVQWAAALPFSVNAALALRNTSLK